MNLHRFLTFICLILGIAQLTHAQVIKRDQVPAALRSKSITVFPNNATLKTTVWEKKGANYIMSFEKKGQKNSVTFDPKGKILRLYANIRFDQLPNEVFCYLEDNYRRHFEDSAFKIVDDKQNITYEAVVYRDKNDKTTLIFGEKGNFISIKK